MGIIPAHAGFTRSSSTSRGPLGGSSPHTRGLHDPNRDYMERTRIIPAHAGFTFQVHLHLAVL